VVVQGKELRGVVEGKRGLRVWSRDGARAAKKLERDSIEGARLRSMPPWLAEKLGLKGRQERFWKGVK
jgi:hypothetical protein